MKSWQMMAGIVCLALALSACGGGDDANNGNGGGSNASVPASPTKSLTNSSDEARTLAEGTIEGSGDNVSASRQQARLDGFSKIAGATTGASGSSAQALKTGARLNERFLGKETRQLTCADIVAGNSGEPANEQIRDCSGTVTYETNITDGSIDNSGSIAAGTFIGMTFNNLSYTTTADGSVSVNGTIRIEYLEQFVLNPASGRIRFQATNLSSTSDGESFGPETLEYIISFNGNNVDVIANGVRLTNFDANYTDTNNYTITEGRVIDEIGGGYLQIDYSNWQVVDGVPQTGSRLVVVGTNGSATVTVLSSTGTNLSMRITITADGSTEDYDLQISITDGQVTIT